MTVGRQIACLAFIITLLTNASARPEEIEDFDDLDLEELLDTDVYEVLGHFAGVVFSASKHKQDIGESPSTISVISREQIENTHCTDVICLLRQVPEVGVIRYTPMFAAVGARALVDEAGDKVLVLVDGQEINSEMFGTVFWQALSVHLEDIERIEVIRGPGSALYGANAHSMLVSIFTRKDLPEIGTVYIAGGEQRRASMNARVGRRFGNWSLFLSGGLDTADHWHRPGIQGRRVGRVRLGLEHKTEASATTARASLSMADGEIYTVLGKSYLTDAMFLHALLAHVTELLQAKLSFGMLDTVIPMNPDEVRYQGMTLGWIPSRVPVFNSDLDGEAQITLSLFSGNLLIAGGNYRWAFATGKYMDPEDIHQHRVGVFVHDEQHLWERLTLVGSVRFDYNSLTPWTISPRVAVIWQFVDDQFARVAFGRAFRKPSFFNSSIHLTGVRPTPAFPEIEDIFKNGIGNEDINNESITTIEVGYYGRFLKNRLVVEADAFYNQYRDTINFHLDFPLNEFGLPDLSRGVAEYRNAGREVDSIGGSASITFRTRRGLRLNANYTFRHSFYVSDPKGVAGAGKKGDRVNWEPAHLANLSCYYAPETGPRLGATLNAASDFYGYVSAGGAFDQRVPVPQDAAIALHGFAAWRFGFGSGWMEAGVRVFNLLNSPYYDYPGTVNPEGIDVGGELLVRRITLYVRGML